MPKTSVGLEPSPSHLKSPSPSCLLCILNPIASQYFIFGCVGSSLLCRRFSSCGERGLLASHGAPASHCTGFSCGAQALGGQPSVVAVCGFSSCGAQVLLPCGMGGSSHTRDRTHVSCMGRQILNHWTIREISLTHIFSREP